MEAGNPAEPSDDELAVQHLIAQLRGDDYYPNEHINVFMGFSTLKARGVSIVPALVDVLNDPSDEIRARVIFLLGIVGDQSAVEPLISLLRGETNAEMLWQATVALGTLKDRRAVEPLIERLQDDDEGVRTEAVEALRNIGDQQAVEPLLLALSDPYGEVRSQAVFALGRLRDRRAIEPLIGLLEDEYVDVRHMAAGELGKFGDARALPALTRMVQHDAGYSEHYGSIRDVAARAIEQIKQQLA